LSQLLVNHTPRSSTDPLRTPCHHAPQPSPGGKETLPAYGSFALRLVKAVRCCPVLVVKVNSRGPYLRSDNAAMGETQGAREGVA
jgi:hypothetical protein